MTCFRENNPEALGNVGRGRGGNACFQVSSPGKRGFACGACVASDPLLRFPWQPRGAEAGGGEQPGPGPGQGRDCQEAWAGDAALGACMGRASVAGSCAAPTPPRPAPPAPNSSATFLVSVTGNSRKCFPFCVSFALIMFARDFPWGHTLPLMAQRIP